MSRWSLSTIIITFQIVPVVVHHWICQQFDDVPEFPVIKTQMGPKHRAAPPVIIIIRLNQKYWHNGWASSMLFQRQQCFQRWVNFFTFYQFNILGSFLRLPRHTSIRPDTPEPLIDCFLFWWTAVASMYCFLFNVIIDAVVAETPKLCLQSNVFFSIFVHGKLLITFLKTSKADAF